MNPRRALLATAAAAVALSLAACAPSAGDGSGDGEVQTIRVAASATPMTDIIEAAGKAIGPGYEVELVEVADYVQPNVMLQNEEIDANLVQFESFMQAFNEANDASLVAVQPVYLVVGAYYSRNLESLDDLPEAGSVVIPADPANTGRALQMLADEKVIGLDPGVARYEATLDDIAENPKSLKFTQVEFANINAAYEEADAVMNIPSGARQIGLYPDTDGLAVNDDARFAMQLVTRENNRDSDKISALTKAITSDEVRKVIESLDVPPAF
ncbi:MetQ/NlpA family ABC transporter substrate-binding protein [Leucobacter sp. wl10]|uniref:MetQ/NlpA family ABC transporter substrate-binding protein n=1 Tax=Leucobacter sp. wl10 TaxID=2304677 RepID=UPI000E5A70B5|nr:MetQ/NlpA family ABC transporter substrate-binding protein [Leucobacter sp. wl10]RGE24216.1 D-methionine-binding lipoprotein MetQ [Leucobacter sp. wl10]